MGDLGGRSIPATLLSPLRLLRQRLLNGVLPVAVKLENVWLGASLGVGLPRAFIGRRFRHGPHYIAFNRKSLLWPLADDRVTRIAVVAEMEDAGGLEPPNTTNVVRVQVLFTAVIFGWLMGEEVIAKGIAEPNYKFDHLQDIPSCPPADALPTGGTFYVFHDYDPPGPSDFQTAAQKAAFIGHNECLRRANSVFSDLAAVRQKVKDLKKRHPLIYNFISAGQIKKEHGVLQRSGSTAHWSFWVCGRTSMHAIFVEKVT